MTITSTANSIRVDFNSYAGSVKMLKGSWKKDAIASVILTETTIMVTIKDSIDWKVSADGNGKSFKIDSVDGTAVVDLADLYGKLIAVM